MSIYWDMLKLKTSAGAGCPFLEQDCRLELTKVLDAGKN